MPVYPPTSAPTVKELADLWERLDRLVSWMGHVVGDADRHVIIRSQLHMLDRHISLLAIDLQDAAVRRHFRKKENAE